MIGTSFERITRFVDIFLFLSFFSLSYLPSNRHFHALFSHFLSKNEMDSDQFLFTKKYLQVSVCHIFVIKNRIRVHFMHDHKKGNVGNYFTRGEWVKTVCISCGFPNFHFLANLHYNVLLLDLCLFN